MVNKRFVVLLFLLVVSLLTPIANATGKNRPKPERKLDSARHSLRQREATTPGARLSFEQRQAMHSTAMQRVHSASPRIRSMAIPPASGPLFGFVAASTIDIGGPSWYPIAAGDFNGDSKQDFVTISALPGWDYFVVVMLGNGDGTFTRSTMPFPFWLSQIFAVDMNGDGKLDVVAGNTDAFVTYLGNGDGTFAVGATTTFGTWVTSWRIADFDADHKLDVIASVGNTGLMVFSAVGDGTYVVTSMAVPASIEQFEVADFNGDGALDVICNAYGDVLHVLTNNGDGTFASSMPWTDYGIYRFAVADVNADEKTDIIAIDTSRRILVLLGDGAGAFTATRYGFAGYDTETITVADVNNDAKLDAVFSNESSDVTIALGNGDGSFTAPEVGFAIGGYPSSRVAVADFDGDSIADLVVSNETHAVVFLKGYGDGTFKSALDYWLPLSEYGEWGYGNSIAKGDFNHDGVPDFVIGLTEAGTQQPTVFFGNPDGTLTRGQSPFSMYSAYVTVADFNADGWDDIAFLNDDTGNIELWLNDGAGAFPNMTEIFTPDWFVSINAADVNGDGAPDIVNLVDGGGIYVFLNDGTGAFDGQAGINTNLPNSATIIDVADVNGDDQLDVVAAGDYLSVLLGNGDGTFDTSIDQSTYSMSDARSIAIGDLNNDRNPDLAVTTEDSNNGHGVLIFLGNGDGTFQDPTLRATTPTSPDWDFAFPNGLQIVDMNNDGSKDLLVANSQLGTVGLLYGKGDGTFFDPVEYLSGAYTWALATADINNDGGLDVVAVSNDFPGVTVLLNNSGSVMTVTPEHNPATYGTSNSVSISIGSVVRGVTAKPTGTVTVSIDAGTPSNVSLVLGEATLDTSGLTAGTHDLSVNYNGDASFMPTGTTLVVAVNKAPTTTALATSMTPEALGHMVTFTATVASSTSGTPTGTVTFKDGTATLGATTLVTGTATFSTGTLAVGSHDITAEYAGDGNFGVSTSAVVTQVIQNVARTTTTTLTTSKNPANIGRPVTLTATVAFAIPTGTLETAIAAGPTGSVVFKDGTNVIGTVALDGTAKAALTLSTLALGNHSITAEYAGTAAFAASTSAAVAQVIENNPADYTLTGNPTSLSIKRGQSGTVTITLTPQNEFDGTATFACGSLPQGVTCVYAPPTLHPTTSAPVTTTLTISTTASASNAAQPGMAVLFSFGGMAFGAVLIGAGRRRRTLLVIGVLVLIAGAVMMTGCAGTPAGPVPTNVTPLGPASVSVNATATAGTYNGSTATHTITIPIQIVQ